MPLGSTKLTKCCAALQRSAGVTGTFKGAVLAEAWQADYAFLIKTGSLTAQRRVPMQLLTFLSRIRNFMLVGAEPGSLLSYGTSLPA